MSWKQKLNTRLAAALLKVPKKVKPPPAAVKAPKAKPAAPAKPPRKKYAIRPIAERFAEKVSKSEGAGADACWLWTGAVAAGGFGYINRGRRGESAVPAHRLAYELAYLTVGDRLPKGARITHACGNKLCVRVSHLVRTHHGKVVLRGEALTQAKLKEAEVAAIRESGATQADLAASFGCTQANIGYVQRRVTWRHVQP